MKHLHKLISDLRYQYPTGVTTYTPCANGCGRSARGGLTCSQCLEAELAKHIGSAETAEGIHVAIADQALFVGEAEQLVGAKK